MALFDTTWYVNSVGYAAITAWATGTAKAAGALIRQNATPTVGNERIFICLVAGTTHATTEPTWTVTRGAKTTDNTVTWQEITGCSAVNGDLTNTPASSTVRSLVITLGAVIKNNGATHYFICSTGGTAGAGEPSYSTTTGATTADNTATWTCIGAVGSFAGGLAPHARLRNALAATWGAAGHQIFIGDNSAETQAATYTILGVNTVANPQFVICHDAGGNYPPQSGDVTTGAIVQTTGNNGISIDASGIVFDGVILQAGSGAVAATITIGNASGGHQVFRNCSLQKLGTTLSALAITGANVACLTRFENTTVKFGATGDQIRLRGNRLEWINTPGILASASSVPTQLFPGASVSNAELLMEGCDLSAISGTILDAASNNMFGNFVFKDCKLHASATLSTVPNSLGGSHVDVTRCSSGAGNYITSRYRYTGTQTTETTIVRTGGASDGTTPVSAKIVTTANARWEIPFEMTPIAIWNDTTGAPVTATVEGIWGGGAVPNNDEIWIEAVYLGDAASPLGSRATGTKANSQATATALTASSETWGGSTTDFKMTATFTPQQAGLVYIYVRAGRASSTFYVDPKIALS